jgi:hypothetical protein
MFLKQRKSTTDPRLRSLVQKTARRGYEGTLEKVARRLYESGDKTWLRSRAVVITFEECWPLAQQLSLDRGPESKISALLQVARQVKQKDAAGLGALAYAFHEGDLSSIQGLKDPNPVRFVSEALSRPAAFFEWAGSRCVSGEQRQVVRTAKTYLAAATWDWDKTCILAGAYLASSDSIPNITMADKQNDGAFPYWVALDKHTPQGKTALRAASAELGIPYRMTIWAGFYFESAVTNALDESLWWEAERRWRLNKSGLSLEAAIELWERVRPIQKRLIAEEAASLKQAVEVGEGLQQEIFE